MCPQANIKIRYQNYTVFNLKFTLAHQNSVADDQLSQAMMTLMMKSKTMRKRYQVSTASSNRGETASVLTLLMRKP